MISVSLGSPFGRLTGSIRIDAFLKRELRRALPKNNLSVRRDHRRHECSWQTSNHAEAGSLPSLRS